MLLHANESCYSLIINGGDCMKIGQSAYGGMSAQLLVQWTKQSGSAEGGAVSRRRS
jgi:hypothetical protein